MTADQNHEQRRRPTDEELPGLLEELEAGGGSVAAFARARGLAVWKLYHARRSTRGPTRTPKERRSGHLIPVHVVDRRAQTFPPLELVLSTGHRLVIPGEFDEVSLRRLMGVLASC